MKQNSVTVKISLFLSLFRFGNYNFQLKRENAPMQDMPQHMINSKIIICIYCFIFLRKTILYFLEKIKLLKNKFKSNLFCKMRFQKVGGIVFMGKFSVQRDHDNSTNPIILISTTIS